MRSFIVLVDQAAISATTLLLISGLATRLSVAEFAPLAVTVSIYIILQGLLRPWTGELVLVHCSGLQSRPSTDQYVAFARLCALGAAVLAVVASVTVFFFQGFELYEILILGMAGAFVHDVVRLTYVATGREFTALWMSALWMSCTATPIFLPDLVGGAAFSVVTAWAVGAAGVSALFGAHGFVTAQWRVGRAVRIEAVRFGRAFSADYALMQGAAQGLLLILSYISGPLAAVGLRGAQTLMGPLNVVLAGSATLLLVQHRRTETTSLRGRLVLRSGVLLGALASVYCWGVQLVPNSIGERVLGDTWESTQMVLAPLSLSVIFSAVGLSAVVRLRADKFGAVVLRTRAAVVLIVVSCCALSFALAGFRAAMWVYAGCALVSAIIWHVVSWHRVKGGVQE